MNRPDRSTGRDLGLERRFLEAVGRTGSADSAFCKLVLAQLADGDRKFGGRFQQRAASTLVVEAGEEALDLVAWAILALTVAERIGLHERDLARVRADLHAASVASATAFRHLSRAIGVLVAAEEGRP